MHLTIIMFFDELRDDFEGADSGSGYTFYMNDREEARAEAERLWMNVPTSLSDHPGYKLLESWFGGENGKAR